MAQNKNNMRQCPQRIEIDGHIYDYESVLKDDFFSINALYRRGEDRYVLKVSGFRFFLGWLLTPFAVWMSRHEYKIYSMVKDLDGVPELGPRIGPRSYLHKYIDGKTLHQVAIDKDPLPADFFDRLGETIRAIHRRRIFYADLNKRGNIILGNDGKPYLIDFQISQYFKPRWSRLGPLSNRLFERLIQEDIYHVYKHKRRLQKELMSDEEYELAKRSRLAQRYDKWFGRPFRKVKRLIYPSGSNEIVRYKWRKMGDRSRRVP